MKNPFTEFRPQEGAPPSPAADRAWKTAGRLLDALAQGYVDAVAREASNIAWIVEHARVLEAYAAMSAFADGLRFDAYDIEALADLLAQEDDTPFLVPGIAGLFLSALINRTAETEIALQLESKRAPLHFLGYRLGTGRTLVLTGSAGDFAGAGLDGGTLIVRGATGNWCGAGMLRGKIRIQGDTGRETGQWMHGGEIQVSGQVQSIGGLRYGGSVSAPGGQRPPEPHSGAEENPGGGNDR